MIDKNDITNKISDVSNAVENKIDTSFIEQYSLGNTYDSILTKANHGKAVVSAKRNCLKTMLFVSDVSVLQTRCVFKKMKTVTKKGFALTVEISYAKVNGFI